MKSTKTSILYGTISAQEELMFDDIVYCKADNNYTEVYVKNTKRPYVLSDTLKLVEENLDKRFYRINRSTLINLDYISCLDINNDKEVLLKSGDEFSVAVRRKVNFKRKMKAENPSIIKW